MRTARSRHRRHGRLAAVVLALLLALPSCNQLNTSKLEDLVAQDLEESFGASEVVVSCPGVQVEAGNEFECSATADDGRTWTVKVTQEDDNGSVTWAVE
jgi:hypothetical protein